MVHVGYRVAQKPVEVNVALEVAGADVQRTRLVKFDYSKRFQIMTEMWMPLW